MEIVLLLQNNEIYSVIKWALTHRFWLLQA